MDTPTSTHGDPVALAQHQWRAVFPAVDSAPLGLTGRLLVLARLVEARREDVLRPHGLGLGDFDVLATLRRTGGGLRPGELQQATLSSSAGMTGRIDRLERAGLVERLQHPSDRRGVRVMLSSEGERLADQVFRELMEREGGWFEHLPADDRRLLERLLAAALVELSAPSPG